MGPYSEPDITPLRLSAIDIISLDALEIRAVLVHLAGSPDPVVAAAVVDAARMVLQRTRVDGAPPLDGPD